MQLRELREYCARRGWEISREYVDHISGAKDKRPELDRLMAGAHQRRFDAVERVRAGLPNARAKGKRLGRPRVSVSAAKIQELRNEGLTLRGIARRCQISKTTVIRALNQ